MAKVTKHRAAFIDAARSLFGDTVTEMDRDMIQKAADSAGLPWPQWLTSKQENRVGRGMYTLQNVTSGATAPAVHTGAKTVARRIKSVPVFRPAAQTQPLAVNPVTTPNVTAPQVIDSAQLSAEGSEKFVHESLVPFKMRGYIPFGQYNVVRDIIASGIFYPVYVTGLSGNGKTLMIDQVAAELGRELLRVNITGETDEDDLLGGFRLLDGKTVWQDGPVVIAMKRGAVVLLDEVDLGTNKIMCLQGVLEGKPIYLKKINQVVRPAKGFNILATANTKGQGSMDGKFVGTNVQNEAFLERFAGTIEQDYPAMKTEEKILLGALSIALEDRGVTLDDYRDEKAASFMSRLVKWADNIRKTFADGGCNEIISTRRLVHIVNAFVIFNQNRRQAVEFCISRFDRETKELFLDLYAKIDPEFDKLEPPIEAMIVGFGQALEKMNPILQKTIDDNAARAKAEAERAAQLAAAKSAAKQYNPASPSISSQVDDIANEIDNLLKAKGL